MFEKISKFRKEIMGAAILLIIMCHSTLYIEHAAISRMYNLIKQFSKIGVDLFFFVSGLGLYFSFSRDSDLLRFYRKRLLRIVPQYAIVIACWGIIAVGLSLETMRGFIWKYSLISFYLSGELAAWFVAAIILLYVVFPLFYGLLRKGRKYLLGLCILIYCLSFCVTLSFSEGNTVAINQRSILCSGTYFPDRYDDWRTN